jgi:hypothetical protein
MKKQSLSPISSLSLSPHFSFVYQQVMSVGDKVTSTYSHTHTCKMYVTVGVIYTRLWLCDLLSRHLSPLSPQKLFGGLAVCLPKGPLEPWRQHA